MLKGEWTVVGEEDNAGVWGFHLLANGAVVWIEDAGNGVAFIDVLSGTYHSIEDSGTVGTDVDELFFLHEDALVANATHFVTAYANLVEETEYGVDCLVGCGMLNVVCLPCIDTESLGVPQLPVVVEQRGVVGQGDARGDEGESEESGIGDVLIACLEHADVWHEVAGDVETCHLYAELESFEALEDCGCDALGCLALVVAWEHTVDVGVVHCPESSCHVHREWVA